jgi:putative ABC transport system substrate-binding protein
MQRRRFVLVTAVGLAAPHAALSQPATKVWRIGYLSMASPERDRHWVAALREGLRDLGYVEGQNLILEQRHAANDVAKALELAADLVRRDVAVMLVYASPTLPTLKKLYSNLPIVLLGHADPVGSGIVASLARPGGNITGLTDGHTDLAPKRLELLKELVPSASRVGVLFNPLTAHALRQSKLLQAAGPGLGVTMVPTEIKAAQDIERAFDSMRKQRVEALVLAPDPSWSVGQEPRIANLAIRHRIPAIGSISEFAEQGLLLAYGTNFAQLWRKSATYVDRVLKGAKAADLPIEYPTKFDLIINLKTAKALGIKVPKSFVMRAERLIE